MAETMLLAEQTRVVAPNPHSPASGDLTPVEPMTLVPSRTKWWVMIVGGGAFAVVMLHGSGGNTGAMLIAALSGFCAALGVIMLGPGAGSLRLDAEGFQVVHFFRTRSYRWSDVSEFGVRSFGQHGEVVAFNAANRRLNIWEKINAALIGGRNAYLPDTYGMTAEDLVRLMTARLKVREGRDQVR